MSFGNIKLTQKGLLLQSKAQTGVKLKVTRIALGDGTLSTQAVQTLNSLIHELKTLNVTSLSVLGNGSAKVGGILTNQGLENGFYWRELGVFAQDPDEGEILYCYGNAGDLADYIPAGGSNEIIEKQLNLIITVGNATNVTATIDESLTFVTINEFNRKVDDLALKADVGAKASLTTAKKGNLVEAINEVKKKADDAKTDAGKAQTTANEGKSAAGKAQTTANEAKTAASEAQTTANEAKEEARLAKELGVEVKGDVVEALNSKKTITDSTTGSAWSTLINKIKSIKEGSGNALKSHVLSGKTFTNNDGVEYSGTMTNRGQVNTNLVNHNQEYTIPKGYHDGLGKVKAVIGGLIASVIKHGVKVGNVTGTFTGDANASASQILSGVIAYVKGSKITGTMKNYINKAFSPEGKTDNITEIANSGSYPDCGLIRHSLPIEGFIKGATRYQYVKNMRSENIKHGVKVGNDSVFMTGSFTSDADAVAGEILQGKKAYVKGSKVTGSMPKRTGGYNTDSLSKSGNELRMSIPDSGYYSDGAYVKYADNDWIESNIKAGVNMFGKVGTLVEGKKWALITFNTQSVAQWRDSYYTIEKPSFIPKIAVIYDDLAVGKMIAIGFNSEGSIGATSLMEYGLVDSNEVAYYVSVTTMNTSIEICIKTPTDYAQSTQIKMMFFE